MMLRKSAGFLLGMAVGCGASAQVANEPSRGADPEVLRLLRQTIAEQTRNPDRIIRNLEKELDGTNAPTRSKSSQPKRDKGGSVRPSAPTPVAPASKPAPVSPAPAERQKQLSEVEARLDDMVRARESRERLAPTNPPAGASKALTQRERLDALLRQVVEGKMTDEQYKQERARILAEPQ